MKLPVNRERALPTPERLPLSAERQVLRYRSGKLQVETDVIATEYALTVYVNDQELATVVCTPDHLDDMVIGFLASEGIIRTASQIQSLSVMVSTGVVRVALAHPFNFNQAFYNKRYIASCCGKGRQTFYFYNDAHTAKYVEDPTPIKPDEIFCLMAGLDEHADLFHVTGGAHTACLCQGGQVILARSDIGRHNALDKLYGFILRTGFHMQGSSVAFSGRVSSEVLLKVAKMGAGVVMARSAPTALALDTADALNITTIGFVRECGFTVYSHPWRLEQPDNPV